MQQCDHQWRKELVAQAIDMNLWSVNYGRRGMMYVAGQRVWSVEYREGCQVVETQDL